MAYADAHPELTAVAGGRDGVQDMIRGLNRWLSPAGAANIEVPA